jgi:hypothetical protein
MVSKSADRSGGAVRDRGRPFGTPEASLMQSARCVFLAQVPAVRLPRYHGRSTVNPKTAAADELLAPGVKVLLQDGTRAVVMSSTQRSARVAPLYAPLIEHAVLVALSEIADLAPGERDRLWALFIQEV